MNHRKINESDCDYLKCEKFIANLEHLLRCLQQAIVEALIQSTLKLIDADILHSHTSWQLHRGDRGGWFAEWPNGQPPLNTTWPWNVKPSLIVLWGVCWMFYDHNNQVNQDNNHHHDHHGWMTTQGASRQEISDNLWTGQVLANLSRKQLSLQNSISYFLFSSSRQHDMMMKMEMEMEMEIKIEEDSSADSINILGRRSKYAWSLVGLEC